MFAPAPLRSLLDRIGFGEPVSRLAAAILVVLLVFALLDMERADRVLEAAKLFVVGRFALVFIASVNLGLAVTLFFALHPVGRLKLGGSDDRPQFTRGAWIAMLFSAGLASGLLYWATAEPLLHMASNPLQPLGLGAETPARLGMQLTIMHWGLHGWGVYVVVSLAIAIQAYRHGQVLRFRSAFRPLMGEAAVDGRPGRFVDAVALFGTLSGVATSIGLSASSMNATLAALVPIDVSLGNQLVLALGVALLGVLSALSGVDRGILWLSSVNAWVSVALLLAFLILGPTGATLAIVAQGALDYVTGGLQLGTWRGASQAETAWQGDWTVFYWAWWLAWTPFVSLFIARISKGRTIREFVLAVALAPTLITIVWFGVFGGTALAVEAGAPGSVSEPVAENHALGLVAVIGQLGGGGVATLLLAVASFLLFTWLVTSLDSATLVLCHLAGVEDRREAKVFWGLALAAVASLLLAAGGLGALQAASIVLGLPLAFLFVALCFGLVRDALGGRV